MYIYLPVSSWCPYRRARYQLDVFLCQGLCEPLCSPSSMPAPTLEGGVSAQTVRCFLPQGSLWAGASQPFHLSGFSHDFHVFPEFAEIFCLLVISPILVFWLLCVYLFALTIWAVISVESQERMRRIGVHSSVSNQNFFPLNFEIVCWNKTLIIKVKLFY